MSEKSGAGISNRFFCFIRQCHVNVISGGYDDHRKRGNPYGEKETYPDVSLPAAPAKVAEEEVFLLEDVVGSE